MCAFRTLFLKGEDKILILKPFIFGIRYALFIVLYLSSEAGSMRAKLFGRWLSYRISYLVESCLNMAKVNKQALDPLGKYKKLQVQNYSVGEMGKSGQKVHTCSNKVKTALGIKLTVWWLQ